MRSVPVIVSVDGVVEGGEGGEGCRLHAAVAMHAMAIDDNRTVDSSDGIKWNQD